MKRFKNILASVDTRADVHPALQWASVLAEHSGAKLKILDVLPEFKWHVRLALRDHDQVRESLLNEKRDRLAELAAPLREKGLDVTAEAVCGQSSVEIIREALRDGHDLVVRVSKGPNSRRAGFIGNTSFGLLRKCPCPVWIVRPSVRPRFERVLAAVDPAQHDDMHRALNADIIELSRSIAQAERGSFEVVYAWTIFGEQMLKSRMRDDEFSDLEEHARGTTATLLDKLISAHGLSVRDDNVHLVRGEPAHAIPHFVQTHDVDLLVMGTIGRSGMAGLVMGNTAEVILNSVQCAVLALKPPGFVSPVKLLESDQERNTQ